MNNFDYTERDDEKAYKVEPVGGLRGEKFDVRPEHRTDITVATNNRHFHRQC